MKKEKRRIIIDFEVLSKSKLLDVLYERLQDEKRAYYNK